MSGSGKLPGDGCRVVTARPLPVVPSLPLRSTSLYDTATKGFVPSEERQGIKTRQMVNIRKQVLRRTDEVFQWLMNQL
jgi:hypothetical protein